MILLLVSKGPGSALRTPLCSTCASPLECSALPDVLEMTYCKVAMHIRSPASAGQWWRVMSRSATQSFIRERMGIDVPLKIKFVCIVALHPGHHALVASVNTRGAIREW